MIYSELKTAILGDTHREDYSTHIERFVQQAESLIFVSLEGYFVEETITESDRALEAIYNLPATTKVTVMRHVIYNNRPLEPVDETLVSQYRESGEVLVYCMRGGRIVFGGIPPTDASFNLKYFGMPARLVNDADTNSLLNDYPQLYIEAAQIYLFKRARNFEAASAMFQSVQHLIKEINRQMKKKLSGGQSANAYNVSFRSSY